MVRTVCPSSRSDLTMYEAMKPVPPVTKYSAISSVSATNLNFVFEMAERLINNKVILFSFVWVVKGEWVIHHIRAFSITR